ncbi:MAG TPA: hypothetical protein VE010_23730, partial [Thermoanaerobaculia bacterium]|nr:hypothetical protein [Thermoanaerobaculia bacterium]
EKSIRQAQGPAMTTARSRTIRIAVAAAMLVLIAPAAFACPVCWGAPDDPMVKGVNNGIWVLLGLVGFVQIGFVAMFWSFWRRGREQRRFRESLRVIEGGPHA